MKDLFKTGGIALLLFVCVGVPLVYAGFGVTPPYVRNTSLTRNSTYEQQILLVRGNPDVAQKATVIVDAPEIQNWISVEQGSEFLLPKGEQKVPMTVKVKVPANADFKRYTGAIRVKTGSADDQVTSGAVNISLGAQIDIDLNVIDKVIKDFRIRKISVSDLNAGHKLAWLYFPGKIKFGMMLENTGNVDISPSEVDFNIYDITGNVLLEQTKNLNKIEKIVPYDTKNVTAEIPTHLPPGSYIARYQIKNGDTIKQEGEVNLNIRPYGTLQTAGFGFLGLSMVHKLSLILPVLAFIILFLYIAYARFNRKKRNSKA